MVGPVMETVDETVAVNARPIDIEHIGHSKDLGLKAWR